jgi:hypothetical protein
MAFPIITVICNGIGFFIDVAFYTVHFSNKNENDDYDMSCASQIVMSIVHTIGVAIFRSQGLLMALVFLCQPDIRQLLKWTNMKAAFRRCCHEKKKKRVVSFAFHVARSDSRLLNNSTIG